MRLKDRRARKIKYWLAQDRKYLRQIKDRNIFYNFEINVIHDPLDEDEPNEVSV